MVKLVLQGLKRKSTFGSARARYTVIALVAALAVFLVCIWVVQWGPFEHVYYGPTYEKLVFLAIDVFTDAEGNNFIVTFQLKHMGAHTIAELDASTVLYNGRLSSEYEAADRPACQFTKDTLEPGEIAYANIMLPKGNVWISGVTVTVLVQSKIQSKGYSKTITLP